MESDETDGFENVRRKVDGHPMLGLLGYARPYWGRLGVGIGSALTTRAARLVPPLVVGAAIDRVIRRKIEGAWEETWMVELSTSRETYASHLTKIRIRSRAASSRPACWSR